MPYITNENHRIHYETHGARDRPTLVLQHGFTDSLECWVDEGYVSSLEQDYFLVLVDARGHGKSGTYEARSSQEGFRLLAGDVLAVLDYERRKEPIHFLGYSMGGTVAWAMARHYRHRLRSLIIVEEPPHAWSKELPLNREKVCNLLRAARQDGNRSIIEMWRELIDPVPDRLARRVRKNDARALLRMAKEPWPDYRDDGKSIDLPCLVYAGERDKKTFKAMRHCVKTMPGNITLVERPGLNHVTSLLRSEALLDAVRPFLAKVDLWEVELRYWESYENGDLDVCESLVDERLLGCTSKGELLDKDGLLKRVGEAKRSREHHDPELEHRCTRVIGDVALVLLERTARDGSCRRIAHTWQRIDGHWRLIGGMSATDEQLP